MTKKELERTRQITGSFHDYLIEQLRDPEMAAEYINEAIEGGEVKYFLHALGNVVKAQGMSKVAKQAGINRENAYRAISKEGNPTIKSVSALLNAIGLRLETKPLKTKTPRRRKSANELVN